MSYVPPTDWELKDFYRAHVDALYRSCMFLTGGKADGYAMVREIFQKLLDRGMEFDSDREARAWMILMAYKLRRKAMRAVPAAASDVVNETAPVPTESNCEEREQESCDGVSSEEAPVIVVDESADSSESEALQESGCEEVPSEASVQEEVSQQNTAEKMPLDESSEPQTAEYAPELMKLSAKNRLVALLYYCEGYRKTEIANFLGCTTFAVAHRLSRIKRLIREERGDASC